MRHTKIGSGLIYALVITTVLSIIFVGLISFVLSTLRYSLAAQPREESLQIAEAGVYQYRWYLAHHADGKTAAEVANFWEGVSPVPRGGAGADGVCDASEYYEDTYSVGGEQGTYQVCATLPTAGSTELYVTSVGWVDSRPNSKRTVRVRLRKPAWSEFAILSDSNIEITSGTTVAGAVHGNNGVLVDGIVSDLASSGVASYEHGGTDRDGVWTNGVLATVFERGTRFPTAKQDFNGVTSVFTEIQAASALQFSLPTKAAGEGWNIIFKDDGTADVYWVRNYDAATKALSYKSKDHKFEQTLTLPDVSAIYLRNDVWVEGTIASGKKVVLAAHHNSGGRHHDIYINGDIVYEDHVSDTVLGLVAEKDIEVIAAPIIDGDGDDDSALEVDAALLAQSGRVGRGDYGGTILGELVLKGAIVTRGQYGFSNTTQVDIEYDRQLLSSAPPFFPTGGTYVIDEWEEIE